MRKFEIFSSTEVRIVSYCRLPIAFNYVPYFSRRPWRNDNHNPLIIIVNCDAYSQKMVQFSNEEKYDMLKCFIESGEDENLASELYFNR